MGLTAEHPTTPEHAPDEMLGGHLLLDLDWNQSAPGRSVVINGGPPSRDLRDHR